MKPQTNEETITINKKEYERLCEREVHLMALEIVGVEWYSDGPVPHYQKKIEILSL